MAPGEDHEQRADELEAESDKLAGESERLADEIEHVRADWHSKREDEGVPGAVKPSDHDASEDPPDRRSST